jgi:hypothetical protein
MVWINVNIQTTNLSERRTRHYRMQVKTQRLAREPRIEWEISKKKKKNRQFLENSN